MLRRPGPRGEGAVQAATHGCGQTGGGQGPPRETPLRRQDVTTNQKPTGATLKTRHLTHPTLRSGWLGVRGGPGCRVSSHTESQ